MQFSSTYRNHAAVIGAVFESAFTASEGEKEGALVGALARRLMAETPDPDIRVFTAWDSGALTGSIIFSRLFHAGDDRAVFIMGPVAVASDRQGEGIGQGLIAHGIDALRREGVHIAMTYGDPAFYSRVGFRPVSVSEIPPPLALSHPEGWLAQTLNGSALGPILGPTQCVPALNDPVYW